MSAFEASPQRAEIERQLAEQGIAADDPLAELARIVGFEPALLAEPAFDLENELLREFEQYDETRVPAGDFDIDVEMPHLFSGAEPKPDAAKEQGWERDLDMLWEISQLDDALKAALAEACGPLCLQVVVKDASVLAHPEFGELLGDVFERHGARLLPLCSARAKALVLLVRSPPVVDSATMLQDEMDIFLAAA